MNCKTTYRGVRYDSLEQLLKANENSLNSQSNIIITNIPEKVNKYYTFSEAT